jgi:hypothetical protein
MSQVTTLSVRSLKVVLPIPLDQVPRAIDPADPRLVLDLVQNQESCCVRRSSCSQP